MLSLFTTTQTFPSHLQANESSGNILFASANLTMSASDAYLALNEQSKVHSKVLDILKISGFLSVFTGALSLRYGIKELNLSQKIQDFWGKVIGLSYCGIGGMQIAGGTAFAGMGLSSLVCFATAAKVAEVGAIFFNSVGGALLGGASLWGAMVVGIHLKLSIDCKLELNEILTKEKNPDKAIQVIKQHMLDPQRGLLWKRILSQSLLKEIIGKPTGSSSELIDKIKHQIHKKIALSSVIVLLGMAAGTLVLLSFISAASIAPWIVVVLTVAIAASWIALDGLSIVENIKEGNGDSWEKAALYGLASFTFGISAAGMMFASNVVFGISAAMFGLILIIVQLFTIYKMKGV